MNCPDIPQMRHSGSGHFFLIAGPCVIENETMPMEIARHISGICDRLSVPYIFKASYRKANRSSLHSFTGIGDVRGLELLAEVREMLHIPVLTDVHSPEAMCFAVEKVRASGNPHVMLTERGTSFGYHDLIVDFTGIAAMQRNQCPVILDVTHALQQPNQSTGVTAGKRDLIEVLAKAGVAAGFDGLFMETHPNPDAALSDASTMLPLDKLEPLLEKLIRLQEAL